MREIAALAHSVGAIAVCDGAQSAPHFATEFDALGVDFYAFSGHKMCAPMAIGGLIVLSLPVGGPIGVEGSSTEVWIILILILLVLLFSVGSVVVLTGTVADDAARRKALKLAEEQPDAVLLVGLSGRGDKDVAQAQQLLGPSA